MTTMSAARRLGKPVEGFKVIRREGRLSEYQPIYREVIRAQDAQWLPDESTVLSYPVKARVTSPYGPGIMVYLNEMPAKEFKNSAQMLIKVRIPRGALVREGQCYAWERYWPVLCASVVEVLS